MNLGLIGMMEGLQQNIPTKPLYYKMLQIAEKLHAVVVDEDDHKYSLLKWPYESFMGEFITDG